MEASKEYILKYARMGIKIYSEMIERKNKDNDLYYYECLASVGEYAPYDMVIMKHDKEDWGSYQTTYHEIKTREDNVGVNDYPTSLIDAKKINTLQKLAYQTGNRTFINVIYPKDKIICQWEIEADSKYDIINKDINWRSGSIRENREVKLNKLLVELPINEAKKYHY